MLEKDEYKNDRIWLFVILLILYFMPIWSATYFPSQDGPVHLENARILMHYGNSAHHLISEFYELNVSQLSNWLIQLIIAGLMTIFPILIAEKVLLSCYIIIFAMSCLYLIRSVQPQNDFLVILMLPFIYNYTLHMGFYGFIFSLPLAIVMITFWIRNRERWTTGKTIILAVLSLITSLFHFVSLVMACAAIALMWLVLSWREKKSILRAKYNDFLLLSSAFLPGLALIVLFFFQQGSPLIFENLVWARLKQLLILSSLVSYSEYEKVISFSIVLILCLMVIYKLKKRAKPVNKDLSIAFIVQIILYGILYLFAPKSASGGTLISQRLMIFFFVPVFAWLALFDYKSRFKRLFLAGSLLINLVFLAVIMNNYYVLNQPVTRYLQVSEHMNENTVLLPLCFDSRGKLHSGANMSYRIGFLLHLSAYLAAEKGIIELGNYQAWQGYFPVCYKESMDPRSTLLNKIDPKSKPFPVDLEAYTNKTGYTVDYILLYGSYYSLLKDSFKELMTKIPPDYHLIYKSSSDPKLQLYARF